MFRGLAETYLRGAAVFERTAALADDHAEREERRGHADVATHERRQAARARDAARRYRAHARRLHAGADRGSREPPRGGGIVLE